MTQGRYGIGVVSRRTGLKADLLRAWERRYRAVEPRRIPSGRRTYTEEDLRRLKLLREASEAGHRIGQVAGLRTEELEERVAAERAEVAPAGGAGPSALLLRALDAVAALDPRQLQGSLERAAVELSQPRLLEEFLVPLGREIGRRWQEGSLRVIHEHLASTLVQTFLLELCQSSLAGPGTPALVAATPLRQHHELGALMAAATAAAEGWEITYLGTSLPAEELAAAVQQKQARALALSLVYPPDDPHLPDELRRLRRMLGPETPLLVGGRAAPGYARTLQEISALQLSSLAEFREVLQTLRTMSSFCQD